ncbi:MAG: hypothetical protein OHK006_07360 [Thermodesulfovibrionales bacterium]
MKRIVMALFACSVLLVGASAFARPWGPGAQVSTEQQKFFEETKGLRKQMHDKLFERMELYRSQNPDQAQAAALEKEIDALREQIQEKAKAAGIEQGCGNCQPGGMGRGGRGGCMQQGSGNCGMMYGKK